MRELFYTSKQTPSVNNNLIWFDLTIIFKRTCRIKIIIKYSLFFTWIKQLSFCGVQGISVISKPEMDSRFARIQAWKRCSFSH